MQQLLLPPLELLHLLPQHTLFHSLHVRKVVRLAHELVQEHARWVPERHPLRLAACRGVVRRQRTVAHELERDDVRRLEDDVPLRDGLELARLGRRELGGERGDEVVQVGRGPDRHFHVAEVFGVRVVWGRVVVAV